MIGSTFPAMFPTQVRYGAFAIGSTISTSIFGGTAALVIEKLIRTTGSNHIPAYHLITAGAVALVPILPLRETARIPIAECGRPGRPEPVPV